MTIPILYILVHAYVTYRMQFQLPQISSTNLDTDSQHDMCYYTIVCHDPEYQSMNNTSNVI